ncbi:MAG: hypothetical protein GY839_10110 [candidate division Zixibacteria bacterium]|nr:hypothetical protein [candidate division Zixibacteria bacterium]
MYKAKAVVIFMLVALMIIPAIAKKTKTAECKDNVLTDLKLNFTIDVPKNWKTKTFKEKPEKPAVMRALLMQKNYRINHDAKELDGEFTIPEIQIYAIPATITAEEFMDKLQSDIVSHSSKDDIINNMNLILAGEFVGKQKFEVAGNKGMLALFKRPWERHMQAEQDDPRYRAYGGRIVKDIHDVHEVYAVVHDGYLYVINALAENEFYQSVRDEFALIIKTIKFPESGESANIE